MPAFIISTNLKKAEIPIQFCSEATAFLVRELGKPAEVMLIQVCPDQVMTFGNSAEPCANITLHCIGVVGPEKNRELAPKLSDFIEKQLGIKKDRSYTIIYDVDKSSLVWNGATLD
ncbi:macrophage migration inhibitory factor [Elysia marginata]|uniref:L-dopachrome isomerase n=1 Tax=Elysia marginata TaxID=1093978 RepID=A0AAV4HA85_9GAST|nr:macrophage migration inhibitory factor [Elysia marginata]